MMARARPRFDLPPRGLTDAEAAGYLGLSASEFSRRLPELEAAGFPKRDPLLGDRRGFKAIEAWWDGRSGLATSADDGLMDRIRGGQRRAA